MTHWFVYIQITAFTATVIVDRRVKSTCKPCSIIRSILANIQTDHHIDVGQDPWGCVPCPAQHASVRKLEEALCIFGLDLDECDQS